MAKKTVKTPVKTKKTKKTAKLATTAQRLSTKNIQNRQLQSVNSLHKLIIAGNLTATVLVMALMAPVVLPITVSYLTKDVLLSDIGTVFVPAERVLLDIDLRWILVGLLLSGALYSLLLLTRWRANYTKALEGRVWGWRWVYLALSCGLLTGLVAVLTGIYDVFTVKLMILLTAAGLAFAWLHERQNERKTRGPAVAIYLLGLASVLIPWKFIGWHALFTTVYGLERLPWYVYAAQVVATLGVVLIFVNLWLSKSNARSRWTPDYATVERNYLAVALLTQLACAAILVIGLPGPGV